MSAAIAIQAPRVALRTIFKIGTDLSTDFRGEKMTAHEVGYPEELVVPRSDKRGSITEL